MLPDRCSVASGGKRCLSPPEFAIAISAKDGEYMVGVACGRHQKTVIGKIEKLQLDGSVPKGAVTFSALKPVGTDCVKGNAEDFVHIDQRDAGTS